MGIWTHGCMGVLVPTVVYIVCQQIYVLFPGDYLSVISCYYQVLVEVPSTSAVCLDQPPMRII